MYMYKHTHTHLHTPANNALQHMDCKDAGAVLEASSTSWNLMHYVLFTPNVGSIFLSDHLQLTFYCWFVCVYVFVLY